MTPDRALLAATAVCCLLTLAVPTVAFTGHEEAIDDVVLESTSPYATLDNDELRLDLEKLNDRAVTTFDDVFAITVNDETVERLWISNDVDGLEFYANGDRTATVSESSPLEPSSGDTTNVGVEVDTRLEQADEERFTVHVEYAEDDEDGAVDPGPVEETPKHVDLESLSVHPKSVETGDSVTVNATYANHGEEAKTVTSSLTVDGTVVDRRTIEIEPGETESVVFEREMQWPGRYDVGVDGTASERVTVEGPPIDVLEAAVEDTDLTAGETARIRATVTNPTDTGVERTLELTIDGIVVDTKTVWLEANAERTVAFERPFDEPGTYDVAVSGVDAGAVTVGERAPITVLNRELSAATTAALAPPLTMGALFLAIAANRRWSFYSG